MHRTTGLMSRKTLGLMAIGVLALTTAACGPVAGPGAGDTDAPSSTAGPAPSTAPPTTPPPPPSPSTPVPPTPTQTASPTPPRTAKPAPVIVLRPGDSGPKVRAMQARLKQIGWFSGDVSDSYGPRTTAAVRGFQQKRGFPVTGVADQRTYDRIISMTRPPTKDELNNVHPAVKPAAPTSWDVDKRCLTGRVICISKSTRSLTWVVDGAPQYSMDVRFGRESEPTREGVFSIYRKQVDVISNLYHTPMPYSMFFSGGQAIHYSGDFARNGYNGSSHGCVNVRNMTKLKQLYNDAPIGTKVVIHW